MEYCDLFKHLKDIESYDANEIEFDDNTVLRNYNFESNYRFILPGGSGNNAITSTFYQEQSMSMNQILYRGCSTKKDAEILENIKLRYHVIAPKSTSKANGVLLMFHGFNEKHWAKYLP